MKLTSQQLNKELSKKSYRRFLLNDKLTDLFKDFQVTKVVDLGGSNVEGEKYFKYPKYKAKEWIIINISEEALPDVIGSIYETGLENASVDAVVCTEVFEHLADPFAAIAEIKRILKPGGIFIGSTPFLFKVHGDPDDYFRYTESALRNVILKDFSKVELFSMGGGLGTVGMLITQVTNDMKYRLVRYAFILLSRIMILVDYKMGHERKADLTTGYIWRCEL